MKWKIEKLVDMITKTAMVTKQHPYEVVNKLINLSGGSTTGKEKLRTDLNFRLKTMEKELPWNF